MLVGRGGAAASDGERKSKWGGLPGAHHADEESITGPLAEEKKRTTSGGHLVAGDGAIEVADDDRSGVGESVTSRNPPPQLVVRSSLHRPRRRGILRVKARGGPQLVGRSEAEGGGGLVVHHGGRRSSSIVVDVLGDPPGGKTRPVAPREEGRRAMFELDLVAKTLLSRCLEARGGGGIVAGGLGGLAGGADIGRGPRGRMRTLGLPGAT